MGTDRHGSLGEFQGCTEPHRDKRTGHNEDLNVALCNAVAIGPRVY